MINGTFEFEKKRSNHFFYIFSLVETSKSTKKWEFLRTGDQLIIQNRDRVWEVLGNHQLAKCTKKM